MPKAKRLNSKQNYFSERMLAALDMTGYCPVSVFCAPIGFGKTTLMRKHVQMLELEGCQTAWINIHSDSLDEFWQKLMGVFGIGRGDADFLEAFPRDYIALFPVIDRIRLLQSKKGRLHLFLDSFEIICSEPIKDFLLLLTTELSGLLRIEIASRSPVWAHNDLPVITGSVALFTTELFAQTPEEIQKFYRLCGLSPLIYEATQIYEQTGGWFALLHLHVMSCITAGGLKPFTGADRIIHNIISRTLPRADDPLFLLIAPAETFSVNQLIYIHEAPISAEDLKELIYSNAFLSYSFDAAVFRVHPAFRRYLNNRFSTLPEKEQTQIARRHGAWYFAQEEYYESMDAYYRAKDYCALLEVLMEIGPIGQNAEDLGVIKQYFIDCPREILIRYPEALLQFISRFGYFGEKNLSTAAWTLFNESLDQQHLGSARSRELKTMAEICRAQCAFNDCPAMITHYSNALKEAPHKDFIHHFMEIPLIYGGLTVFPLFYRGGSVSETQNQVQELMHLGKMLSRQSFVGLDSFSLSEEAYLRCDWQKSEIYLQKAMRECNSSESWSTMPGILYMEAKLALMNGRPDKIDDNLTKMRELVRQHCAPSSQLHQTVDVCECYFNIKLGRVKETAAWLLNGEFLNSSFALQTVPVVYTTYGAVLLAQEQYSKLVAMEDTLNTVVKRFSWTIHEIYNNVHIAAAYEAMQLHSEAREHMIYALNLALPHRFYMPLVENNLYIKPLLNELLEMKEYKPHSAPLQQCISAYNRNKDALSDTPRRSADKLGLTEREYQVALLAANGATNGEISQSLLISVNTVKATMKSVFKKLGIESRREIASYVLGGEK